MRKVRIYHNPNCGTSRNVLAMIKHAGLDPEVIEYLVTPPTREELQGLIRAMGIQVRDLVRINVPEFEKHHLADATKSDSQLLDAMMADPILINRPIVVTSKGVKLCRPSEVLLDILPVRLPSPFTKEDGQVVQPK
ncbi:arsenate reductase (glutaredoxin) [Streptococcus porcinus]|uniref:arsenate reductase (glutathione/glutaredoxin) n=2 Tax=Streptococcus porcinus TaxID=1340 RepID=A0A4V0H637_STRPO|nr:arsenate reductase (glutaredoxin) [Streptococcus porcinus]EGJ28137.1 arsenate reductase [Streptococcus porcinus str. Jelinkova 176]MBA2796760.1 arsenate reductase (glutaredoxin) [Streptococcus porcinus]SQG43851.1 ArsC family protein [Streptococcus porcinus]VTT43163.1 ArsC family protein [Streptococcus porcinus]VTT44677.1 ArsC family protein [Streptococcus porcinus]